MSVEACVNNRQEYERRKPVLKVTDRRLFNSDGTPRDVERVEPTTTTPTPPSATGDAKLASSANSSQANPASSTAAASTSPIDVGAAPLCRRRCDDDIAAECALRQKRSDKQRRRTLSLNLLPKKTRRPSLIC
jgi:hypothetical protein